MDPYHNPVTMNDPKLTERMLPVLRKVPGATVKVMPLVTASEDFAYFANAVPSFFFFVGVTPPDQDPVTAPGNHSPLFYLDEKAIPLALRAFTAVAADYLAPGG
jgi:amidohydrolase